MTTQRPSLSLSETLRLAKFYFLLAVALAACSPKTYALRQVADAISSTGEGSALARDDDPELVRDAVPFALKTMESLADTLPDHLQLRLALARGFTQYGYAFVQQDADESNDPARAKELRDRAARLYLRARSYGLDGLRIAREVTEEQLRGKEPARTQALAKTTPVVNGYPEKKGMALTMLSPPTARPRYANPLPNGAFLIERDTKMTPTPMKADATRGLLIEVTAPAAVAMACRSASLEAAE